MTVVNNPNMKTIRDKKLVVGADFAGFALEEAVCAHLRARGWEIADLGVRSEKDHDPENMFHRVGLRVGAKISEGEYERALIFCGTGMGIHIAASKCPHVHAAVVESVPAGLRCITGNNCNVLAMGGFYVSPRWASRSRRPFFPTTWAPAMSGGRISMNTTSWPLRNWKPSTTRSTRQTALS